MLGLYPSSGAPISGLLIEETGAPLALDLAGILGMRCGGTRTLPTVDALDLLALEGDYLTDAVMLIEVTATDGALTVTAETAVLGRGVGGRLDMAASGGDVDLRWSDADWTSQPDDTLPNTYFEGRASEINLERSIPIRPDVSRRVAAALSEVLIDNADGDYDGIDGRLAVDGRSLTVSLLGRRSHAYSDRRIIFDGIGQPWRADAKALHVLAASKAYRLDVPMLELFGGTGGEDGGDLLKGVPKMEPWGVCRGVTPQLIDEVRLIYMVSPREVDEILAVYVRAAPVTLGTMRVSYAVLEATPPVPGEWDWTITADGAFFRLGSAPDGTVTFDVRGDASAGYSDTHGGIMRRILARAGLSVSGPAFASLEGIAPGSAGIVFSEQVTFAEALDRLAASAFLWWGDAGDGVITVGRLSAPGSSGGLLLNENSIQGEIDVLEPPQPLWRVTASYGRNWTVLSGTDLVDATTIGDERWAAVQQASYSTFASLSVRQQRNAQAGTLEIETLFDEESDALGLCNNILSLLSPGRGYWRVPTGLAGLGTLLGQQARIEWRRHGLTAGRNVRVVGQSLRGRRVDLLVMG